MGNSIVRIPFNEINLVPGNVLIEIDKKYKIEARSRDTGEVAKWDHLIRGRVVRIASTSQFYNQSGTMLTGHLRVGDEVWVRGRKGYPIEVEENVRLFVFNEWDVAINMGSGGVSGSDQPPMYTEKIRPF
uniref:Co-chaperonin GroES n=1 Tax=Meloidogyne incognita TaxID=6306 RepID=A0A914KK62_MELIC